MREHEAPRRSHRWARRAAATVAVGAVFAAPSTALAADGGTTPGDEAKLKSNGQALAPEDAPKEVQEAIWAANEIEDKRYEYGGGHSDWKDNGYDCSGAVSYALGKPGAKLLDAPIASGEFEKWGERGKGEWMTVYANENHVFLEVAGLRFDTSETKGNGPGWSEDVKDGNVNGPFEKRHWKGL